MKKSVSMILSILLSFVLLVGCGSTPAPVVPDEPEVSGATEVSEGTPEEDASAAITIIHTNDIHGYYSGIDAASGEPSEWVLGLDTVAAVRDAYAEEGPVFLLDAGDATQGIFFVTANEGEAAIDIMNAVGYDAMTLGNHEFDHGWFQLLNLIGMAEFPILSQLDDSEAQETENLYSSTVIERDGVRLGVFGLTTPETQFKSEGGFGRDFGTTEDLIADAKAAVTQLREEEQVDYVVCLSHLGVDDMGYGTSYDIRDNVEGIDLIVDGHSHTTLEDIENVDGKTQITSTGSNDERVGVARLAGTGETLQVDLAVLDKEATKSYTPDAAVAEVIAGWAAKVAEEGDQVVTQLPFAITIDAENERTRETVMGNILTDAMREVSGADIAMQNGGGIRDQELAAGDVTKAQIISILPYGNVVQMAEVKGDVLLEMLEHSVALYPETNGGFAQLSGMSFTFNPNEEEGARVVSATVGDQPLDPEATYTLCTNDFVSAGGDLYTMLEEPFSDQLQLEKPEFSALEQALIAYLADYHDELVNDVEGRIIAE